MGSEADGGRAVRAVHEGTGAVGIVVGAPGGPGEPREPGVPGGPGGPRGPGDRSDPEGLGNPGSPGTEGEAGAASAGVPRMEQAPRAPGPDGDAAPAAGGPGGEPLQIVLTVPFPSPVEAEIAHWFLTSNAQLRGPVREELDVNGSVLTVLVLECRLTAEDPGQLQMSITSRLGQVSRVIRTIQRVVPPFFAKPQQDKGG
uniref:EKC/KEOPS complex subunit LAGE3-like n=1 Tax=Odobenus rosmarus divergens TaxID=9708 RepID=UPI00063C7E1C|nr:PREDICTED: EKC/KEOPS complex subunit LAGE3-like [Odobenus rosmarus divergens]